MTLDDAAIYECLAQKIDEHPLRAPKTPALLEILRRLFTPEEAAIALNLGFQPQEADGIAARSGVSLEQANVLLGGMLAKGGVRVHPLASGQPGYALVHAVGGHPPGIFEALAYSFISAPVPADVPVAEAVRDPTARETRRKEMSAWHVELNELWRRYFAEGLLAAYGDTSDGRTQEHRVLAVERALPVGAEIQPWERVSTYIEAAKLILLNPCTCRTANAANDASGCTAPLNTCLAFSYDEIPPGLPNQIGFSRVLSKEEAYEVIRVAEEEGLVHTVPNITGLPGYFCNCCNTCCALLSIYRVSDVVGSPAPSNFIATVHQPDCTACGLCAEICPINAVRVPGGPAVVNEARCQGCGLCVTRCEPGALSLRPREKRIVPPHTYDELLATIAQERGRPLPGH